MTTLKAHFDGRQIVLDEPVPPGLAPNTPVTVVISKEPPQNGDAEPPAAGSGESALAQLAKLARPGGLPPDFSEQHDHYVKGLPKR